jgi:hypothetical protein
MYAGAALSAVVVIITLVTIGGLKSSILTSHPDYTAAQRHNAEVAAVTVAVLGGLVAIGLWLWMAWANGRGHGWARIVATVFFGINTLDLIVSVFRVHAAAALVVSGVVWLVGLVTVVLLFSTESTRFYRQRAAPR